MTSDAAGMAADGHWQPSSNAATPPRTRAGRAFDLDDPLVLDVVRNDTSAELVLWVDPGLPYFEGHFPGQPLLPAVCQVNWLTRVAEACFPQHTGSGCTGLTNFKFLHPILPCAVIEARIELELARDPVKIAPLKIVGTFSVAGVQHAKGTLKYRG